MKLSVYLLLGCLAIKAFAADYYVSSIEGSDLNDGSLVTPFKTISKAVEVMTDGDTCHVKGGVYRETVDLSNKSGLEIKSFEDDEVTVTGLDVVDGWVKESENLWYSSVDNMLTRVNSINSRFPSKKVESNTFESQVYKNDEIQFLARWPNKQSTAATDLMEKDWYDMTDAECQASDPESFKVNAYPAEWTAENLKGAYFWTLVQNCWSSWMVPVKDYDPATKTISLTSFYSNESTISSWIQTKHNPNIMDRQAYWGHVIVLGAKVLLDDENEFFTDFTNNRLYVYCADPNQNTYEVKTRYNAFVLPSTASNITITGINVKAATIKVDGASNCVIAKSNIDFPSYGFVPYLNNMTAAVPGLTSLILKGNNNILRDSKIENCFGGAFEVQGNDSYIHNCMATNINVMASWHSAFVISGNRNTISHCTVYKTGRSGFSMEEVNGCRVIYCDVSQVGYLTDDLGGLHSSRDVQNSEIAYNWFHDIQSGHAIYMDNYNSHYIVHHNVIWNAAGHGINQNRPGSYGFIINNTVFENWAGKTTDGWTAIIGQRFGPWSDNNNNYGGLQEDSCYGSMWFNNIARHGVVKKTNRAYYGFQEMNNSSLPGDFLNRESFDPAVHRINSAADSGIYIKGITEMVDDGKPDMGAYEITNDAPSATWKAGCDFETIPAIPAYKENSLVFRNLLPHGTFYFTSNNTLPAGWSTSSITGDSVLAVNYNGYNDPPANQRNSVHARSLRVVSSTTDPTFAEVTVDNLEAKKYYNFSGYVRLAPHEDALAGVDDVQLYAKDSKGNILGTTTVKTFPNYSLNGRATKQKWFMTELSFQLPEGESAVTVGFSTDDVGTFFVDNVGLCRKFSRAPKVTATIPKNVQMNVPVEFSVKSVFDDDGDEIAGYRWTVDGTAYDTETALHTFSDVKESVEVTLVATDKWGVESMPVKQSLKVWETLPPSITCSDAVLDTENITVDPVVITPSIQVTVQNPKQGHNTLSLYVGEVDRGESEIGWLEGASSVKNSISSFSEPVKMFIPSGEIKDGTTYYYRVKLSGDGEVDVWSELESFTLDRLNMIPFSDRALAHLSASDRRLKAGEELSLWQNLTKESNLYDAWPEASAPLIKADSGYSIKGMKSILFNESGMKINTPVDTGVTAFISARRQAGDLEGDLNQRIISVLGESNDYSASAGGWSLIRRISSSDGSSAEFGPTTVVKRGDTLRKGPIYLGKSANASLNTDYRGEIFEVVVYDEVLSDQEVDIIQNWLNAKWSTLDTYPEPESDWDGDGFTNAEEAANGTDPSVANIDSDGDGASDREEMEAGTDYNNFFERPAFADADKDGLSDELELLIGSNPGNMDSDGDLVYDNLEWQAGTSPFNVDSLPELPIKVVGNSIYGFEEFDGAEFSTSTGRVDGSPQENSVSADNVEWIFEQNANISNIREVGVINGTNVLMLGYVSDLAGSGLSSTLGSVVIKPNVNQGFGILTFRTNSWLSNSDESSYKIRIEYFDKSSISWISLDEQVITDNDGGGQESRTITINKNFQQADAIRIVAFDVTPQHGLNNTTGVFIDDVALTPYMEGIVQNTPVFGMDVSFSEGVLNWTVERESGVAYYQVQQFIDGKWTTVQRVESGEQAYMIEVAGIKAEVRIVVVDYSGFSQAFLPEHDERKSLVYDLNEGWNLISIIGDSADLSGFSGEFWRWNGQSYERTKAPEVGEGVWYFAEQEKQLTVESDYSNSEVEVVAGWNLVGFSENREIPEEAQVVYTWSDKYDQVLDDGLLIRGVGYWIYKY